MRYDNNNQKPILSKRERSCKMGTKMTNETREKIRVAMNREEVKEKIRVKMRGNEFAKGYVWNEEQKEKLSKSLKKYHKKVRKAMKLMEGK